MKLHRLAFLCCCLSMLLIGSPAIVHAQNGAGDDEAAPKPENEKPKVTLVERGEEPRTELRLTPEQGANSGMEMLMRMQMEQMGMSMRMPPMRMLAEVTVEEVAEEGDIIYLLRYTKTELGEERGVNPMMRQQMEGMMESMEGLEVRATISDRGIVQSTSIELPEGTHPMMRDQIESMAGSADQFATPLPEESVGRGAKWTVETTTTQNGMEIRQTATYTLRSIDNGVIELDVELKQDADEQEIEGMRLKSYDGEGSGTTTADLSQIMPRDARLTMKTDLVVAMNMGGGEHEMEQSIEMEMRLRQVDVETVRPGNNEESEE